MYSGYVNTLKILQKVGYIGAIASAMVQGYTIGESQTIGAGFFVFLAMAIGICIINYEILSFDAVCISD